MSVVNALVEIFQSSGFVSLSWQNWVMILVSFVLLYLAIVKKFEPLLLVPIAFGMLLVNIYPDIMYDPLMMSSYSGQVVEGAHWYDTGVLRLIYAGVKSSIFPCLIFMGVGAMTDFGPLLANPSSLLLGAAAQLGIYVAFLISIATNLIPGFEGFTPQEAASIAIIGGADGPTAIYLTSKLAPQLLGPIAVAAYSYMALIPLIQPPIMKLLTTKKEREINNHDLHNYIKLLKKEGLDEEYRYMLNKYLQRFFHPFVCVLLAIMGALLGFSKPREQRLVGFTIAIGSIFLYYITLPFFDLLAEKGVLHPFITAVFPPFAFLCAIIVFYKSKDL